MTDYTDSLPDECLVVIFNHLTTTTDRNNSSLVSHRWLRIDAQTRTHLTLNAKLQLQPFLLPIFTRFVSLTQLFLSNDHNKSLGILDDGLSLIALRCPNLTRVKLRGCYKITHQGLAVLAQNCKKLKKFSSMCCIFGGKGIMAILDHCSSLEELSLKELGERYLSYRLPAVPVSAASLLKVLCLKGVQNGRLLEPFILGFKNLKTLKLSSLIGNWDRCLEMIAVSGHSLVEVHLGDIQVSDIGLTAISRCSSLEVLHIYGYMYFTNLGLISFVENCKGLKKLYIDNRKHNFTGSECLMAIAEYCLNLEELVLIGVDACCVSLEAIAVNCRKLERLDLCSSKTITDVEISHIAEKCVALKKVLIKECCVSDKGVEAFALGCLNLVEIRLTECENVTHEVKDRLRARRGSLVVKLDCRVQELVVEVPPAPVHRWPCRRW